MKKNNLRVGLVVPGAMGVFLVLQSVATIGGADEPNVSPPRSGTITIAAFDSLPHSKANATYACDGIDDHIEIQKAINSLPETKRDTDDPNGGTGGDSIQLLEGTFNIGGAVKFYDKAVNLIGTGKYSTTWKLQKGVNDDMILVGTGKVHGFPPGRIAHMALSGNSRFQDKGSGISQSSIIK